MKDKDTLLQEYLMQTINLPIGGLIHWVEQMDWEAIEDMLAHLCKKVREHLGHHLISREEQGEILTEKWKIAGDRQN